MRDLRERLGLTLTTAGLAAGVTKGAWHQWEGERSWPAEHVLERVIRMLEIPQQVYIMVYGVHERDGDLSPKAYRKGNPVEIEHAYFDKTRGDMIQNLYRRAMDGSAPFTDLYIKWMKENRTEWNAQERTEKPVVSSDRQRVIAESMKARLKVVRKLYEEPGSRKPGKVIDGSVDTG